MSSNVPTIRSRTLVPALFLLGLGACAQPPSAEMDAANQSLAMAREGGAAEYAPTAMTAAEDLRASIEAELAAQQDRFALLRSYDSVAVLTAALKAASEQASTEAASAREVARQEASTVLAEAQTSLEEVRAMLESAPTGKGTAADIAALKMDLDNAATALANVQTAFADNRFLDAKAGAIAAKEGTDRVRTAIEQARLVRRRS